MRQATRLMQSQNYEVLTDALQVTEWVKEPDRVGG
jgi:hypothetical protein